ncbi:MAG: hypothetical protein MUO85_04510 [candidate division Zixibacteria bacterium]|nr:hypothetical protein [candidate division Zixibacteria bacterium]
MKITREKIKKDSNRDVFWTKIIFESKEGGRRSKVLASASWEYIIDKNRISEVRDIHLEQWIESVINKWESKGDSIFDKKVHYDVYANTNEGKVSGLEFLKEIDASET